jgi:hypothetical protein
MIMIHETKICKLKHQMIFMIKRINWNEHRMKWNEMKWTGRMIELRRCLHDIWNHMIHFGFCIFNFDCNFTFSFIVSCCFGFSMKYMIQWLIDSAIRANEIHIKIFFHCILIGLMIMNKQIKTEIKSFEIIQYLVSLRFRIMQQSHIFCNCCAVEQQRWWERMIFYQELNGRWFYVRKQIYEQRTRWKIWWRS